MMQTQISTTVRAVLPAVLAAALASIAQSARADEALVSPWVEGFNNKARIIAGKAPSGPGRKYPILFAGIEILMPPGWKTYWVNPGEAGGVPPVFDFSRSENIEPPIVTYYPAPHRLVDPKAGINIGYKEHVIFPVPLVVHDKSKPVVFKVKASYGVCKDICVPAEMDLSFEFSADAGLSESLAGAVAKVPAAAFDPTPANGQAAAKPEGFTDPGSDPRLKAWKLAGSKINFETIDPAGKDTDAFLLAGGDLYMPVPKKISETAGISVFEADLAEGAKPEELKGKMIAIVVTGNKGQSITNIQLP